MSVESWIALAVGVAFAGPLGVVLGLALACLARRSGDRMGEVFIANERRLDREAAAKRQGEWGYEASLN